MFGPNKILYLAKPYPTHPVITLFQTYLSLDFTNAHSTSHARENSKVREVSRAGSHHTNFRAKA